MTTIVTRAGKGSPLTNNEVDTNFTNLNDAKIETLTSTDTSVTITGTGSTRDLSVPVNPNVVSGPASATDNAIARFDTTTGKLIQNSSVTIDDDGNAGNINAITFDTTPGTLPTAAGSMFWDTGDKTPSVILNTNTNLQLGQENVALVYNGTGSTITRGSVVAVSGAQGQRPSVVLADADSEALSASTLGIAAEAIANGAEGFICTFGLVRGINTSTFTAGAPIYLSQTAGQFTATRPAAPAHTVILGWVIKVNASSGEVFVHINNGWELDELHNVLISGAASGNTLIYDAAAGVWKNANLTAGTGISVTGGAGSISIANTGVTSVTGTSPVASSGGATPAISLASGYGDTQNPYASKTANNFLAAPNGSAGVPTFRAIVAADIPTLNQNTTGTASNVTGTVAIANGGTGATTAANALTNLGAYAATNPAGYITSSGNAATATSATSATTATNQSGGTVNATTGAFNSTVTFAGGSKVEYNGDIYARRSNGTTGVVYFAAGGPIYLYYDGTNFIFSGGNVYAPSFIANSDERLKDNWENLQPDFISKLAKVKNGTFIRKDSELREPGVSAQSMQQALPEAVSKSKDGYLAVNYGGAALVSAIELAKVVEELRAEIARLKAKVGE